MIGQTLLEALADQARRSEDNRAAHREHRPVFSVTPWRIKGAFSSLPSPDARRVF